METSQSHPAAQFVALGSSIFTDGERRNVYMNEKLNFEAKDKIGATHV